MPKQSLVCRACGKTFEADDSLSHAFCVYCGQENALSPRNGEPSADLWKLPTDPAARRAQLEQVAESGSAQAGLARDRLLFWFARFDPVGHREARYGDKFIEFISILIFYSRNYPSRSAMKRARKDRDKFLSRPALVKAMAETSHPHMLFLQEFSDAAEIYLKACRDDKHYGSKLFDIVRMKESDIAAKAAEDVAIGMMGYLCQLGLDPQTELLIQALHKVFPTVFTQYPEYVDDLIAQMQTETRAMLYRVLAKDPAQQEDVT